MSKSRLAFCMCGSFCTLKKAIDQMEVLKNNGYEIFPVMSYITHSTDTKFGKHEDFNERVRNICGKEIIHTIPDAEPIGPNDMVDGVVICPCTGNTLSKLSLGITDTPVTMATKAALRKNLPVIISLSTNDALGASAKNIGQLFNTANIFFVPFSQDDPVKKPHSLVADLSKLEPCIEAALQGKQYQPLFKS